MTNSRLISVVVPILNEEENLLPLYERTSALLQELEADWELILVDDGSTDRSREVIRELHERDTRVKGLFLSRNFGHEIASTAGLDAARGDAVILMDADLQDPPEIIPQLVEKWQEGYEIVSAQRARRSGESIFKRATAHLFYRFMNFLIGWELPRDTGDFRLMDRAALDAFLQCRERNRFVRALTAWTGFRHTTVGFERAPRRAGKTKYGAFRLLELAITSTTSFSVAPLRIASIVGLSLMALALIAIAVIVVQKLTGYTQPRGYAFLLVSIWFLGGVQCLLIGIVGEYIGRTYVESQHRPLYFVRERLGIAEDSGTQKTSSDPDEASE
jgi:glycosyltransferase involved in cell wall biosynthesis